MTPTNILTIKGDKPGPTVAVFAGMHGNEKAGVYALHELLPTLAIHRGTLHIAFGNPPAIDANVRMLEKNLNRCFYKDNTGTSAEDVRARQLMAVLDTCDALLDLHMFYDDAGEPFIICEDNALDIAKLFDITIVSTNWTATEPGATDGYMYEQGKIGICVECGPISKSREYAPFAKEITLQFLQHFGMVSGAATTKKLNNQINIVAYKTVHKTSESFTLLPGFRNFQALQAGQCIASDKHTNYYAQEGDYIIFPHYKARVGEEAYIVGRAQ